MRVLTFLHSFELGGVERIALRLVREWRERGIEAPLFLGRLDGDMGYDVGRDLDMITPRRRWTWLSRWETIWMIITLPGVIRSEDPDVLFCAGNTYAIVAFAMKLLLGRRCPPIVAKISNNLDREDKKWWKRRTYRFWLWIQGRFIDHFVGLEEPARAEIRERLHVSDDRITVIPLPALSRTMIDRARKLRALRRPDETGRSFVAVGRLAPQKNVALMLRAFQRGARAEDHLTIIGDGPQGPELFALAERLGIAGQVTFLGYVASPVELLAGFDVLLLSSNYEGVPAVVLEALAADLNIVATDCSRSMRAVLRDGILGTLVPVRDEAALANAIAEIRSEPDCSQLSLAQAERFTVEHAAGAYLLTMSRLCRATMVPERPLSTTPGATAFERPIEQEI